MIAGSIRKRIHYNFNTWESCRNENISFYKHKTYLYPDYPTTAARFAKGKISQVKYHPAYWK